MSYLLMCVAILFCAANSCLLRAYGSKKKDAPADVFGFNCLVSVGWGIILTVLFSAGDRAISPLAALFGTVYGLLLAAFLLFKNLAMCSGNLALTTLIASCAFLIPTAYSVCFTDESVSAAQLAGIAALLGALALCVLGKPSKGFTARWAVQIATPPGQQGRNSRSIKDIIPGQQKLVKKRNNIISPAVFHRQERRETQASACGKLPAVTKAAPQRGLS